VLGEHGLLAGSDYPVVQIGAQVLCLDRGYTTNPSPIGFKVHYISICNERAASSIGPVVKKFNKFQLVIPEKINSVCRPPVPASDGIGLQLALYKTIIIILNKIAPNTTDYVKLAVRDLWRINLN